MTFLQRVALSSLFLLSMIVSSVSMAAGLLIPNDQKNSLSIKSHNVEVMIEDNLAITQIEQVFLNHLSQDTEAHYAFPVPKGAVVGEFTYWVDNVPIHAEVVEKERARDVYQKEKQAGREAALVEKDSYKKFDVLVTPVRAGQDVRIRLVYLQHLGIDLGVGRYVYPLEDGGTDVSQRNSFWQGGETVKEDFSFMIDVRSSYPVENMRFASHANASVINMTAHEWRGKIASNIGAGNVKANSPDGYLSAQTSTHADGSSPMREKAPKSASSVNWLNEKRSSSSHAHTQESETYTPSTMPVNSGGVYDLNKDIVVYWRHQQGLPAAVDLSQYKAKNNASESKSSRSKGTFSLVITPGESLPLISQGRDWTFVLDTSGSMQAKLATLVEGIKQALGKLHTNDRFRVVLFNDNAFELVPDFIEASSQNIQSALNFIGNLNASGGTNLYAGLKNGLSKLESDRISAVVLVTDGVANVGVTARKAFFKLLDNKDVRLFTFVMGNSANEPLLSSLTKYSNGFAQSVSNSDDIIGQIMWASEKVKYQALHDVEIKITGVKTTDITPKRIGTIYRGQQIQVLGHYWGEGEANVTITGKVSGQEKKWTADVNFADDVSLPELERLWAFATIKDLETQMEKVGEHKDTKQAIRDIALEYGLVTDYTSMIVVREEAFKQYNIERKNHERINKEQQARQMRQAQPVQSTPKPKNNSYAQSRPTFSGGGSGGSIHVWMILLLGGIALFARKVNRQKERKLDKKERRQ